MKIVLLSILITFSLSGFSQNRSAFENDSLKKTGLAVTVFKTYDNFLNGTGEKQGVLTDFRWSNLPKSCMLYCQRGDSVAPVETAKSWGFSVGTSLFRIGEYAVPLHLFDTAELIYYESGTVQLGYLLSKESILIYSSDLANYSLTPNDPVLTVQSAAKLSKKHPELTEVCSCIRESLNIFGKEYTDKDQNARAQRYIQRNRACIQQSKERIENK